MRVHEREFRGDARLAAHLVLVRGDVELFETRKRVVERGNRLEEPRRRQVGERVLEARERARGLAGLIGVLDEVDRLRAGDEHVHAPPTAFRAARARLAVARRNHGERAARRVGRARELRAQVVRDARDVLHHAVGTREDRVVHALQHVAHRFAAQRHIDLERVVDVARTVALDALDVAEHLKERNDLAQFFGRKRSVAHDWNPFTDYLTTGICAAATDWPRRRAFSSGMKMSTSSARHGSSASRPIFAVSRMICPPRPEVTRPRIMRFWKS